MMLSVGLTLNYLDAVLTARCVRSMLADGIQHVFVWDNSEDQGVTAGKLAEELSAYMGEKVHIKVSPVNTGFAIGVNKALVWIRQRFPESLVLLMNNDAELLPGAYSILEKGLNENAVTFIAYPSINHSGTVAEKSYYHRLTGLLTSKPLPGSFFYPSGCCLLIKLPSCKLPLFDEAFFMYGEDWVLGYKLLPEEFVHVPQILVTHQPNSSSVRGSSFYENRLVAAHLLFARKVSRCRLEAFLLIACRFPVLLARAVVRCWRFKSLVPCRALYEGWRIAQGHDPLIERARLSV